LLSACRPVVRPSGERLEPESATITADGVCKRSATRSLGFEALSPRADDRAYSRGAAEGEAGLWAVSHRPHGVSSCCWSSTHGAGLSSPTPLLTAAANSENAERVLKAMHWLTPPRLLGAKCLITSSAFNYYQLLYGRASGYAPLATPGEVVASAAAARRRPTRPDEGRDAHFTHRSQNPFMLYPKDSRFHLLYNDTGVVVYKLAV